ncbi:hypothetical protein B296_00041588 [Ensete ventricosum]|uniref:Phytocyanin domain-containing protein n=1 Tax=Ensete ventricosum TaxID=4639 RepID=A0A426XCT1_ENSVE|nr:hypothetical protein B296_00041588 [Ensete ventricosum]
MVGRSYIVALALICLCLFYHLEITAATDFTVGDSAGWSFNVQNWPNGKSFKAGDVLGIIFDRLDSMGAFALLFKYGQGAHNVVVVDADGYNSCKAKSGSKTYTSGNDKITLAKGTSYFICSFPSHCDAGMKIKIVAN